MIKFTNIKYRNFMSTSNTDISIQLDKIPKTLIVGDNGVGKSTLYLALYWGLFGKPFDTSLKNDQLINSLNKKNMLVEVEFSIGTINYKIVRGLKPVKFEIYINDELKPQEAATKDYQKFLLINILKMSEKTFRQIVILGSSQHVPFMRLKAAERRSVIEDLLDIQYFSIMSDIVKKRVSGIKDSYTKLVTEINTLDNTIELNQKRVDELNNHNDNIISENTKEQVRLGNEQYEIQNNIIIPNQTKLRELDNEKLSSDLKSIKQKNINITQVRSQIFNNKTNTISKVEFFHKETECPTCEQSIQEEHKDSVLSLYKNKIVEYETGLEKADLLLKDISIKIDYIEEQFTLIESYNTNIRNADNNIINIQSTLDRLDLQNTKLSESVDTDKDEKELLISRDKLKELISNRNEIVTQLRYFSTIVEMLKDGGIKTKIVNQYVPIINMLIQKYLDILEFNVEFTLDDEFKETIKSRGRDNFSYGNFSDGQKIRIDLALLFTFREITRMKNSASSNLLIMDEIGDNSMDAEGVDDLVKIINGTENSNIFIISHNSKLIEQFDDSIEFILKNNFTQVKFN